MKRGKLDKWTDIKGCENLLFFSQLVNELLFDYSIPSNRIPTLNSHYLCKDAIDAIDEIESKKLKKGNLEPIMEELYSELKKDPVFQGNDKPLDYFLKYQNDRGLLCKKPSDLTDDDSKKIVNTLSQMFFSNNNYYFQLRDQIIRIIKENKPEDQGTLFLLTKSILTELKNSGYNLRYICMLMSKLFWEPATIVDSPNKIDDFFGQFDFKNRNYQVVFKYKKQNMGNWIDCGGFDSFDDLPCDLKEKTDKYFSDLKPDEKFLIVNWEALDPFEAEREVAYIVNTQIAVYRLYDHRYRYRISSAECEVFDDNRAYKVEQDLKAVEHAKLPPYKQIVESMNVVINALTRITDYAIYKDYVSLIGAIQYHSHSLNSLSEENQLLDLWAIFESLLNVNDENMSKICRVCMYLVPLLKQKYIYSLFKQLADDIKNYDENLYVNIVGEKTDESEIVRAICEFTLLDDKREERETVFAKCEDFPLLKERINYYSDKLNTPAKIHSFVEKHADRVRWQIKRIYRNRNMIVHNGNKASYISLLIENLHSYVDDFISHVIHGVASGKGVNTMCQELLVKECKWVSSFQKVKDPITPEQIGYMLSM